MELATYRACGDRDGGWMRMGDIQNGVSCPIYWIDGNRCL